MKVLYCLFLIFVSFPLVAYECDLKAPQRSFIPQFAKHFKIDYFQKFKVVHVDQYSYFLSGQTDPGCRSGLLKILTPVKKTVMMSTTYLPALSLINARESLFGFQGKRYIVSKEFDQSKIQEVAYKLNPEDLLKLKADLIMGYESNLSSDKQLQVLKSLNIPFVINKDFEEKSPLARAEWLIFIASFYDQEELAQKIFTGIARDYQEQKKKNAAAMIRPRVLVGDIQNGMWVTSGGESDLAQLIADAGGDMVLKRPGNATQNISLEILSQEKMPVDFWLTHNMWGGAKDLTDALRKDSRYSLVKAKNIYNNNLIKNENNYNDFWEMGMQRPDLLLLDLSALFHPELAMSHKLRWYRKL